MRTRNKKKAIKSRRKKKLLNKWATKKRNSLRSSSSSKSSKSSRSSSSRKSSRSSSSRKSSRSSSSRKSIECVICLENIDNKDISEISCSNNHFFHDKCIKKWLEVKTTCPSCRENFLPNNKAIILKAIDKLEQRFNIYTQQHKQFKKFHKHFNGAGNHKVAQLKKIELEIIYEIEEFNNFYDAIEDLITNEEEREFLYTKHDGIDILNQIIKKIEEQSHTIVNSLKKYKQNRRKEHLQGIYNIEDFNKYENSLKKIDFIKRPEILARFDKDIIRHIKSI